MTEYIYILLTDTGTWLSKAVKRYTNTPYNHVSLSLDPTIKDLYSFGRKRINNPFYGGFLKEDVIYGVYRQFPDTSCLLLELEITTRQKEKIKRLIRTFEKNEDYYSYNLIGLLGVMIKRPIEIESMYFCSQFVSEVLKRAGVELWDKSTALVTPEDFRSLSHATVLYEGNLYDFKPVKEKSIEFPYKKPPLSIKNDFIYPIDKTFRAKVYKDTSYSLYKTLLEPLKTELKARFNIFF